MSRKHIRFAALALAGAVLVAAPAVAHAQRKADKISREEIAASAQKDGNVYDLIRSLRPQFYEKPRGVKSIRGGSEAVAVYVDGVKDTDVESLKLISANTVEEIRYYDPQKAQDEFGHGNGAGGAIAVKKIKAEAVRAPARDTTKPPLL